MWEPTVIRRATAGDARALALLSAAVQDLHFTERPDVFKAVDLAALEAWFRETIAEPLWRILIAEVSGTPAGYAAVMDCSRPENAFGKARRWREVEQLSVSETHRRQGVATALLERVAAAALADGIPMLELNTWTFNDVARECFESLGFSARSVRYERPIGPGPR